MTVVLPAPVASLSAIAQQFRVGLLVGVGQALENGPALGSHFRRDLGQPDERFDRFDLAEEGSVAAEVVAAPVLEETGGLRGYAPVIGARKAPPVIDASANLVNGGGDVVELILVGKAAAVVEFEAGLLRRYLGELRLGNWGNEFGTAAAAQNLVSRLAVGVEFPELGGVLVRGVEDWLIEEAILHGFLWDGLLLVLSESGWGIMRRFAGDVKLLAC